MTCVSLRTRIDRNRCEKTFGFSPVDESLDLLREPSLTKTLPAFFLIVSSDTSRFLSLQPHSRAREKHERRGLLAHVSTEIPHLLPRDVRSGWRRWVHKGGQTWDVSGFFCRKYGDNGSKINIEIDFR